MSYIPSPEQAKELVMRYNKEAFHIQHAETVSQVMGELAKKFDPEKVDLFFESKAGKIQLIENGVALDYSEEEATKILSEPEVTAIADVKMGKESATAWGCDLTYDYVKINADYRS